MVICDVESDTIYISELLVLVIWEMLFHWVMQIFQALHSIEITVASLATHLVRNFF